MKNISPYGSWKSPITADLVTASALGLNAVQLEGAETYWLESRAAEKGRVVLVRRAADGSISDLTPPPFNVRTRVHEYGGGAYTVHQGTAYFANFTDQRLYRVRPGEAPEAITPEGPLRFADFQVQADAHWLVCVVEDHSGTNAEARNAIARVDLKTGAVAPLVRGSDFYSSPRLSADGRRLAYLTWNHPNMPWDDVELWAAEITPEGFLEAPQHVAGGPGESVMQPRWSPDGTLHFLSDRSDWWNLYRWDGQAAHPLAAMQAEFGYPNWVFGMSTWCFAGPGRIAAAANRDGRWQLLDIDTADGSWRPIETPYDSLANLQAAAGRLVFTAGSPTLPGRIAEYVLETGELDDLRLSSDLEIDPGYISIPQPLDFPTENAQTAHAFYYPPHNSEYAAPPEDRPPLLVFSHGGPTGQTSSAFNLGIQFWTSRGFAVVDVNYGGSTGYGRAYRRRLYGQWGVVDVDDCVNAARHLVAQGLADGERLAIRGGSAGGYTTLAALTFRDVFKAGASYYGVSDLIALAEDTHKFESRYLDQLIGPYPERRDLYIARSPIYHVDRLSTPIIFFQGLEDRVVPPNQAEMMVEALRTKGVRVEYVPFEGEQHGFRQAQNIRRALEAEYAFYAQVFGFESADNL